MKRGITIPPEALASLCSRRGRAGMHTWAGSSSHCNRRNPPMIDITKEYRTREITRLRAENERLTAENERMRAALREAFEVHAGSDGFIPETAGEGYQQQIIKQMVECINAGITALQENRNECTICPSCNGQTWRAVKNIRLGPGVYEVRCDCCGGHGWIDQEHEARP